MSEDILQEGDPFDDPRWQAAELVVDAPPRPAKGYITVSLTWLARVLPLVRSAEQLLILQVIYRRCLLAHSRTVPFPNSELKTLGIHWRTKYRALTWFEQVGLVSVKTQNGQAPCVTLHDFP
jgi:hypothetical protein